MLARYMWGRNLQAERTACVGDFGREKWAERQRETERKTDAAAFRELCVALLAATSPSAGLLPRRGKSRVLPEMPRLVNGT